MKNIAIITGGDSQEYEISLKSASNLTSFFNNVITSEMVGVKKPNPTSLFKNPPGNLPSAQIAKKK